MSNRTRGKINASLAGFWVRQRARAAARKAVSETYLATSLPVAMVRNRSVSTATARDPFRERTYHVHTEFRPLMRDL